MRRRWRAGAAPLLLLAIGAGTPSVAAAQPTSPPQAARARVEVTLVGGRTLLATQAERVGDVYRLVLPTGTMTLQASQVACVRRLEPVTPPPAEPTPGFTVLPNERAGGEPPAPDTAARERAAIDGALRSSRAAKEAGDLEGAESTVRSLLLERSGDGRPLVLLGEILVARGRFEAALAPLRQAGTALPPSWRRARDLALAEALSRLDRTADALAALAGTPDDEEGSVAALRDELERDLSGSELLSRHASPHFVVHAPPELHRLDARPLLEALEDTHAELATALGDEPHEKVVVVIHPGTEFWETTQMGGNVAGLYDGKVRVPEVLVGRLGERGRALLRHEVAHAFVDAITKGRADRWWQEGIAEHFEGEDLTSPEARLAAAAAQPGSAWPPAFSHQAAHSRAEHFIRRHGMGAVRDVLRAMATAPSTAAALDAATGQTEPELILEWRSALAARRR